MTTTPFALRPTQGERAARSVVAGYILLLVAAPLLLLAWFAVEDDGASLTELLRSPTARAALSLTLTTSTLVGAIDIVLGTATAWVLVRYTFPGRSVLSACVDLPLAIPTLVAGMMVAILYGPTSLIGARFEAWGMPIVFAKPGIVLALLLVTLPFVIRAIEPVLLEVDPAEEETARMLGASPARTFRTVFLPAIGPAALSSGIRALGRALGEFGSLVVVSGNVPGRTLTAPVFIFGEIESGAPRIAAAASAALLLTAVLLHVLATFIERSIGARHG
jgi:sulfate/thiosulfate transport system permease protein